MKALILLFTFLTLTALQGETLTDTVRDTTGAPLPGILVRAAAPGQDQVETRTDSAGRFTMNLPGGPWWVEVDPAELLERGYFCVPGSLFPPLGGGDLQPPFFILAVSLQARLEPKQALSGDWFVELNFDWMEGVDPIIARQCRVERSTDGVSWQSLGTVLLVNPPIRLIDPNPTTGVCLYRAVPAGELQLREITWSVAVP